MTYSAEISRSNPTCLLFLIDQSASMSDPFGGGEGGKHKADAVADAVNRLLQNLVIRGAKAEGVRDYYHVGVIGYGARVGPAFGGVLAGRELVPISEVALNPARVESRSKQVEDGAGGLVEQTVKFPVWFDAVAENGTPMCKALTQAHGILTSWLADHPDCFPPIVINITDGEANDGDPREPAKTVMELASSDGNVLLFNLHLSSHRSTPIEFPDSGDNLPDKYAAILYEMSSKLPDHMLTAAHQEGYQVSGETRGFAFNADIVAVVKFLDIGTRPSNLR